MALSDFNLRTYKIGFQKFVIATIGMITWPSVLVDELEKEVGEAQSDVRPCTAGFLALLIMLSAATYYVFTINTLWVLLIGILPTVLIAVYAYMIYLFQTMHLSRFNSIQHVKKSDSIQLEDTMREIFDLLQAEYPSPIRFYLAGDYSQLTYTGKTKTTGTLIRLKEAILYPRLMEEKEEATGAL